jgi:hypothetical protein
MKGYLKIYAYALFIIFLSGCSSTGSLQMNQQLKRSIDHNAKSAVFVHPHDKMKNVDEGVKNAVQNLKSELFGRLVSEGVFSQVVNDTQNAEYKLDVSLIAADEVSQGMRIMFGVLAGSNELKAQVQLIEVATDKSLADFTVAGESASHPLSSENDMDDAINQVTDKIIVALKQKNTMN